MAYTILNTDGTTLLLLADGQIDQAATSITLIGKNYPAYGSELNNNFVKLLANSATTSGSPPRSPLKGQTWYDTTAKRLKVYDNGFKVIGGVAIASSQPAGLQSGDLWFDSTNDQLTVFVSGSAFTVGPAFPAGIGESSLVLPHLPIKDNSQNAKQVLVLKSYGNVVGLVYSDPANAPFNMDATDALTYLPGAPTTTVVSGITLLGDLSITGQLSNNYLSTAVNLDILVSAGRRDAGSFDVGSGQTAVLYQNPAIQTILNKLYPPVATSQSSSSTSMAGVPVGTQARVLTQYSQLNSVTTSGYQVRVFHTVGSPTSSTWLAWYFNTATSTATNIIA